MENITQVAGKRPKPALPGRPEKIRAEHCYKVGIERGPNRQISLGLPPEMLQGIDGIARALGCSRVDVIRAGLRMAYGEELDRFSNLV